MERVIKGLMGYGAEKEGKPATHVILTVEEYEALEKEIKIAKNEIQSIKEKAKLTVDRCKLQAEDIINKEQENTQKRIGAIQSEFNKAKDEIDRLNNLNANLNRIMRERANAKRGLKPKKTHHGYMVIDSQQYNYVFRYSSKGRNYADDFPCWKVRIQSPYDSSIPYEIIHKKIREDLAKVFGSSLGLSSICNVDNFKHGEFKARWEEEKNFIFKTSYKANIKSGLWEVDYLVKSSIIVPEDMRVV